MGSIRNGARSFLDVLAKGCKFSRMPGFRAGLTLILGANDAQTLMSLWEPACAFVDTLIAADNFFNQKDATDTDASGEDVNPLFPE